MFLCVCLHTCTCIKCVCKRKNNLFLAGAEAAPKAEEANRKDSTDVQSLLYREEQKPLVRFIYHLVEGQTLVGVWGEKLKHQHHPEVNTARYKKNNLII